MIKKFERNAHDRPASNSELMDKIDELIEQINWLLKQWHGHKDSTAEEDWNG
jgi:hypothetical protein